MMSEMRYLIVDVGSTTTKALLFETVGGEHRLTGRSAVGTTVEAPNEDVMVGVDRAVAMLAEQVGWDCQSVRDLQSSGPADVTFLATSSAGGGLQVLVCGLVKRLTTESAERTALGAGAILLDVFSSDDGRPLFERMESLRRARPDMILLAGGVEGGQSADFAVEFCDLLHSAKPSPRFGAGYRLPVIYAGNSLAVPLVEDTLDDDFELSVVANLRPSLESENLGPARERIHELFLSHTMEQAPGYATLKSLTAAPILPTPLAVGRIMTELAKRERLNILAADIGGATTDIFSVIDGRFSRTVSANLGLSYSAGNVLASAGTSAVSRWLPHKTDPRHVQNLVGNKVIHPTSIPDELTGLLLEQAVAREALRLALEQHIQLTVELPGERSRVEQAISSQHSNFVLRKRMIEMQSVDLIIGSGGVLSHAPNRAQAASMLLDSFQPQGYTRLAVDSVFMLPHLGALSELDKVAALQALERDCLIPLGPSFSLMEAGQTDQVARQPVLRYELDSPSGRQQGEVAAGSLRVLPLRANEHGRIRLWPLTGGDIGGGRAGLVETPVTGGVVGVILDCRGRGLPELTGEAATCAQRNWLRSIGALTEQELAELGGIGVGRATDS